MGSPGFRSCAYVCPLDREEAARLVLLRFGCIESGSVRYSDGAIRWRIDLAMVPTGDGPAVELMLQRAIARHTA